MIPTPCQIRFTHVELRVLPMKTRLPFRYGIATLNALPHLFVEAEIEIDGRRTRGIASDGLAPKWFSKNPRTSTQQDLADMIAVVQHAARLCTVFTKVASLSFFALWQMLEKEQAQWAFKQALPPLLWQFGVSLMERAALDALCKHLGAPVHEVIKSPALGIDWGQIHPALDDHKTSEFLPAEPVTSTYVRHTVGLSDPLRVEDIAPEERLDDGLPQSLDECIRAYGLRYFKVKLSGEADRDHARLAAMSRIIPEHCGGDFRVTMDGNEHFQDFATFRSYFERLRKEPTLEPIFANLLWVEQPLHRDKSLTDAVGPALRAWTDAPPLLIDESDGNVGDAHKAMRLGYSGVSHKNCKGIIKGLANAAFVCHHRRLQPKKEFILSGEDLVNIGPVALLQDLAMMAILGVGHIERNGHHYFKGLTMHGEDLAALMRQAHPDLYEMNAAGVTTLRIRDGQLSLASVNAAPFGCDVEPDLSVHPTVEKWKADGGMELL
jgi:L-alanine-DL-glutamate epimerase-like enolase superfamily enzyme